MALIPFPVTQSWVETLFNYFGTLPSKEALGSDGVTLAFLPKKIQPISINYAPQTLLYWFGYAIFKPVITNERGKHD